MRKIILTTLGLFISVSLAYSQAPKVKFGKVSDDELTMKQYEKDSSANAVVLYNKGEINFYYNNASNQRGFEYEYNRHMRIKIFSKEAFDYANHEILLFHADGREERIKEFKAYTINKEGDEAVEYKLSKKDLMKEEFDEHRDIMKFTMPNVKEGSVIDIEYTVQSDFIYYLREWQFQYNIPVVWSEFEIITPEFYTYQQFFSGYQNLLINEKSKKTERFTVTWETKADRGDNRSYNVVNAQGKTVKNSDEIVSISNYSRFAIANMPAFKEEPYMASTENYLFKINFELASVQYPNSPIEYHSKTWKSIDKDLLNSPSFGDRLSSNLPSDLVPGVIQGLVSEEEKTIAIYKYIQDNYKWNGNNRMYASSSLKDVIKDKSGSSAELNLLLVKMLREAGINANPVISSTRNNGMVNQNQPGTNQFNYVVAHALINQTNYLLDATDDYCYPNFLPKRCLNGDGRIIGEKFTDWINLNAKLVSKEIVGGNFSFDEEQNLTGKIKIKKDNYFAYDFRNELDDFESFDKYVEEYQNKNHNVEINEYAIENVDTITSPININYAMKISEVVEQAGDLLIFNPLSIYAEIDNPYKSAERKYPINYAYPFEQLFVMNYMIPEGYSVEQKPENIQFVTQDKSASFLYKVVINGNLIQVTCKKNISKIFFLPTEYSIIRDFYNQMIAKQSEKIILKKI